MIRILALAAACTAFTLPALAQATAAQPGYPPQQARPGVPNSGAAPYAPYGYYGNSPGHYSAPQPYVPQPQPVPDYSGNGIGTVGHVQSETPPASRGINPSVPQTFYGTTTPQSVNGNASFAASAPGPMRP